jgi:hypothetical protein
VGELDLQGALQKQGHRLTLDAAATARRLAAAPERPRLDLALAVALDPRAVSLTATVAGPELGQVTVRAAGRPPRRMDSGAAWAAQLTAGLLETADVQLTDLSLGGLQAAAGLPASASGALAGAVTLRGPRTRATLLGANLQVAGAAGAPQARLRIELGHDPGRAFAHVRLNGAPLGHGDGQRHRHRPPGTSWTPRGGRGWTSGQCGVSAWTCGASTSRSSPAWA